MKRQKSVQYLHADNGASEWLHVEIRLLLEIYDCEPARQTDESVIMFPIEILNKSTKSILEKNIWKSMYYPKG